MLCCLHREKCWHGYMAQEAMLSQPWDRPINTRGMEETERHTAMAVFASIQTQNQLLKLQASKKFQKYGGFMQ